MFLHSSQPAKESLSDDVTFVALELEVLDDFTSNHKSGGSRQLRDEHLLYLNALHSRGEHKLGLQLLDRALGVANDTFLADAPLFMPELLLLRAEMLEASNSFDEAQATFYRAAETSTDPEMTGKIALRHAKLLIGRARTTEALKVLQDASDGLPRDLRPTQLVTTLAAMYGDAGDYDQAEGLLDGHIHLLTDSVRLGNTPEAALCRLQLVSLLLSQGKSTDSINELRNAATDQASVPQSLIELTHYYSAVCAAITSGGLLSDCLSSTDFLSRQDDLSANSLLLFTNFRWIRSIGTDHGKEAVSPQSDGLDPNHLAEIFRAEELVLQGSAYEYLSINDYSGAIEAFQELEQWREENGLQETAIAAIDSRALAFALIRSGRSEAQGALRWARRRLQLVLGLSSITTLWAVLDEAQALLDHNEAAQAGALVQQVLSRGSSLPEGVSEILLRLRLVLMEVMTRTGAAHESLQTVESLASEAAELRSTAPDLQPILQYQAAAAMAAADDFDGAEHMFAELRRALEGPSGETNPELAAKATYGLARVMQRRGEYGHALSLLSSVMTIDSDTSRPLSLRVRRRAAECHRSLNDHLAAAEVYRSCADDLAKWAGDKDTGYLETRLAQADCLLSSGQYKPARKIYRSIWEILHKDYSGRDAFYIRAVMGNGTCLRRLKDYSGAAFNYRRVHDLEARQEYMSKAQTLDLEQWLAWSLEMSGAPQEAIQHYTEAIRLLEEVYPERLGLLDDLKFRLLCCTA